MKIRKHHPKRNMPQYGIECTTGHKNKRHRIILHQMRDPSNPNTAKSDLNIKEATPRKRSMTISKYQPDLKHLSK